MRRGDADETQKTKRVTESDGVLRPNDPIRTKGGCPGFYAGVAPFLHVKQTLFSVEIRLDWLFVFLAVTQELCLEKGITFEPREVFPAQHGICAEACCTARQTSGADTPERHILRVHHIGPALMTFTSHKKHLSSCIFSMIMKADAPVKPSDDDYSH